MGRPGARATRFYTVFARAPLAPTTEESDAKAVRNAVLHRKVDEIGSKMECMAGRKCEFSHCKTDDFVFSQEIDQTSACGITLTPKEGHLFRSHSSCYYFESPSGRQVTRFDTDLGCQKAPDPGPSCRFR